MYSVSASRILVARGPHVSFNLENMSEKYLVFEMKKYIYTRIYRESKNLRMPLAEYTVQRRNL